MADCGYYESRIFSTILLQLLIARSPPPWLFRYYHTRNWRADDRVDGALRLRKNPRARYPRGFRSDPFWAEPHVTQSSLTQTTFLRDFNRHRWAIWSRRPHHHDRRRSWITL